MPRTRTPASSRTNRDAERLIVLAMALNASGSRVEDRFWEIRIEEALTKLFRTGQDAAVEAALEHLLMSDPASYEVLIEMCETLSESAVIEKDGQRYDVLLIVAPLAVWTRFNIPAGKIRPDALDALRAQLHGHVLASDSQLALAPSLLSIYQIPRTFSATWQWMQRLGMQALGKSTTQKLASPPDAEVANMLADTRYLAGAVVVPQGAPMFRWQEMSDDPQAARAASLEQWAKQTEPTLTALLPGCGIEILLPDAWYTGNREADRSVRPLSIRAAVGWLESALNLSADQLRAVVAGCGENQIDEYRVGFTPRNRNEVVYGCVWPLFGRENDMPVDENGQPRDVLEDIVELLKAEGVTDIRRLPGILPLDFCEDCGAPYFPDPNGEMVHAELPEEADSGPTHFH
nr:DUF2863 family protein [Pseudomonas sp.]